MSRTHHLSLVGVIIVLLLAKTVVKGESSPDVQTPELLECFENGDALFCSFTIQKRNQETTKLEWCKDDEYCVTTVVEKHLQLKHYEPAREVEPSLQVGSLIYHSPYKQYGKHVGHVLRTHPKTIEKDNLVHADWLLQLATAYRTDAQKQTVDDNTVDWDTINVNACIIVLEECIVYYQKVLDQYPSLNKERLSMAMALSQLAESYQFHSHHPQPDQALAYYLQAKDEIHKVLDAKTLSQLEQEEWELMWADVLAHAALLIIEHANQQENVGESVMDVSTMLHSVHQAESMLENAIRVYRKTISLLDDTQQQPYNNINDDRHFYQLQLANALTNLGTTLMLTSTVGRAATVLEEALSIFQQVLPQLRSDSLDRHDVALGTAELMISLSDTYLQAGNYDLSRTRYQDAMEWYKTYELEPPKEPQQLVVVEGGGAEGMLEAIEGKLEEYHASLYGGYGIRIPDDYRSRDEPMYEPDDLYEADLYASLGALQLSNGQVELAMTSFVKAMDLYEGHDGEGAAMADVMLNMAMAMFKLKEFGESARIHSEALALYRKAVGDGKNPLVDNRGLSRDHDDESSGSDGSSPDIEIEDKVVREHLVNMDEFQKTLANLTKEANNEL